MSDGFTFVHCADLHLDSPFEGVRSAEPSVASILCDATFRAFGNVIDLAIRERADFLIIAGDVYDGANRSLRAQLRFRDGLRRAVENGVRCFVSHGNHDPLTGWEAGLSLPEGVHRFGGDVERVTVKRGGSELCRLYGVSYRARNVQENLSRRFKAETEGPFSIGVLHCNVGGNPDH
ncbi:MAG: metallophosphoesterase family protein, partial [Bacillota bacterium]